MPQNSASVGYQFPAYAVGVVEAEKMKTMAVLLQDPNPIHWDTKAVQSLGLGDKPINQGPNNMAYVVNALIAWSGGIANVRSLKVRFLGNVYAGDELTVLGSVMDVEHLEHGDLVNCQVQLLRGAVEIGEVVMSGQASVLLEW